MGCSIPLIKGRFVKKEWRFVIRQYHIYILFLFLILLKSCETQPVSLFSGYQYNRSQNRITIDPDMKLKDLEIEIVPWFRFKKAAVSLTFDDGTIDHYTLVYPALEKRNIKATFFVITDFIEKGYWNDGLIQRELMSWDQVREMACSGHEIGSHTKTHMMLTGFGFYVWQEIVESKVRIESEVLCRDCISFCWPYWRSEAIYRNIVPYYYLASRTGTADLHQYLVRYHEQNRYSYAYYEIDSFAVLQGQNPAQWLWFMKKMYNDNRWAVLCFHGMDDDTDKEDAVGYSPILLFDFEQLLDFIVEEDFWIAPMGTVVKYLREKENISFELMALTRNSLSITMDDGLDDALFNQALTCRIKVHPGLKNSKDIHVVQNGLFMWFYLDKDGWLYFDAFPDGSKIEITADISR